MYSVIILKTLAAAHWVLTRGKAAVKECEWAGNLKTLKLIEWVITCLKGKGMKPHPWYWTRVQKLSLFSTGRCRSQQDVRVSPLLAHPPALVRVLLFQSRKRIPQEQPSRNALIADGHSTAGSAPLPVPDTLINFCKDVLQPQSWWFKISLGQRNKSLWYISRLMDRSSPLVQRIGHFQRKEMLYSVFVTQGDDFLNYELFVSVWRENYSV